MAKGKQAKGPGIFSRIKRYFSEMIAELKKVTWPTRQELVKYTGIVLAFVVSFSIVVGVMDYGLAQLLKLVTGVAGGGGA